MIAALLVADGGDADADAAFHRNLALLGDSNGYAYWADLIEAMRRIYTGHRDRSVLTGLNVAHRPIAERTLDTLVGRVTILLDLWPAVPLQRQLYDLVAGAHGDETAAARARHELETLLDDRDWSELAQVLLQIVDGARDPDLANSLPNATDRAVITSVLHHITTPAG